MATYYLDYENGSDAANGTSFANRWKTLSGATSVAAGDEIRVMASPDPTLVGAADWTFFDANITLGAAVTQDIDHTGSWTGSTGVTAGDFTFGALTGTQMSATGSYAGTKAAYKTLASTLDLSAFQQISLWYRYDSGSYDVKLSLCSDASGDTPVNEVALPRTHAGVWRPIVLNTGAALGSAINSIALRSVAGGAAGVTIANVTACKAAASADSLTHHSLVAKIDNLAWAASTAYSLNAKRVPTPTVRNGWVYKATTAGTSGGSEPAWPDELGATVSDGSVVWTCESLEENWYAIFSFSGAVVRLDTTSYTGLTESSTMYKREPILLADSFTSNQAQANGSLLAPIKMTGGWDRTDMSTRPGDTHVSNRTRLHYGLGAAGNFTDWWLDGMHYVRFGAGIAPSQSNVKMTNCSVTAGTYGVQPVGNSSRVLATGCQLSGNQCAVVGDALVLKGDKLRIGGSGLSGGFSAPQESGKGLAINQQTNLIGRAKVTLTRSDSQLCADAEVDLQAGGPHFIDHHMFYEDNYNTLHSAVDTLVTNSTGIWHQAYLFYTNSLDGKYTEATTRFQNLTGAPEKAGCFTNNGFIGTDPAVVHSASAFSWKFTMVSSVGWGMSATSDYPLSMPIAKIKCSAGVGVSVKVWTNRDTGNIDGRLRVKGGQLAGVPDKSVGITGGTGTWVQTSALTFTPTEDGVIEIVFEAFTTDGNTSDSIWVDDITVT